MTNILHNLNPGLLWLFYLWV